MTTSDRRRVSTEFPGCINVARDSNNGLVASKSSLRVSVRRYLPAASTQLSEMKFWDIMLAKKALIQGIILTCLLDIPWPMTRGKSSAKAVSVNDEGDSTSTALRAKTED